MSNDIRIDIVGNADDLIKSIAEADASLESLAASTDHARDKLAELTVVQDTMGRSWSSRVNRFIQTGEAWAKLNAENADQVAALDQRLNQFGYTFDSVGRIVKQQTDQNQGGLLQWIRNLSTWQKLALTGATALGGLVSVMGPGAVATGGLTFALAGLLTVVYALADVIGTVVAGIIDFAMAAATAAGAFAVFGVAVYAGYKYLSAHLKQFPELSKAVHGAESAFSALGKAMAAVLAPRAIPILHTITTLLDYMAKLSHLSLGGAINSFAGHGMRLLEQLNREIYGMVGRPLMLLLGVGFGNSAADQEIQAGVSKMLAPWETLGGKIITLFQGWFDRLDLTKQGVRIGGEIVSGIGTALGDANLTRYLGHIVEAAWGQALNQARRLMREHPLSSALVGAGAGIGAVAGGLLGGPMGAMIGAPIGAMLGLVLNHYLPKIKAAAEKTFSEIGNAIIRFLGPTTWGDVRSAAAAVWTAIQAAVRTVVLIAKSLWAVFDTLIIKTGAWKVGVQLVRGVVSVLADTVGAVAKAFTAVLGVIDGIIGGIKDAIGWAQDLAGWLGGSSGQTKAMQHNALGDHTPRGGGASPYSQTAFGGIGHTTITGGGASGGVHVHVHAGVYVHESEVGRYISQALTSHFRSGGHVRLANGGTLR